MKALIITDPERQTPTSEKLLALVSEAFKKGGFETKVVPVRLNPYAFCKGCFQCWVKSPGVCVLRDGMELVIDQFINSQKVVFLSPVIFGQFSSNIKLAMERLLPAELPFFILAPDGETMAPYRSPNMPDQMVIGYGDALQSEDVQLFGDIVAHRKVIDHTVYQGDERAFHTQFAAFLAKAGDRL